MTAPIAPSPTLASFPRIAAALALAASLWACSRSGVPDAPPSPARGKNVLFVLIDTLRADHLDAYGYERETAPFLAEIARRGVLFEDVSAPCSWTKPSIASLFTSLYPTQHGVLAGNARDTEDHFVSDVLPPGLPVLAEFFQRAGYDTFASVRNSHLKAFMGFGRGFDVYEEVLGHADRVIAPFLEWLDNRGNGPPRPFFAYLHFLDVHAYTPPPEYRERFGPVRLRYFLPGRPEIFMKFREAVREGRAECPPEEREGIVRLYDASIRFLDDRLRALWAELERRGLADDTMIVVTSDHGEEWFEHGEFAHGHSMADNLLRVPWILAWPGGPAGRRIRHPASLVDVLPTLLDLAGLPGDRSGFVGVSLAREAVEGESGPVPDRLRYGELYKEEDPARGTFFLQQSLRSRTHHFVRTWRPAPGKVAELRRLARRSAFEPRLRLERPDLFAVEDILHDLAADPGEQRNAAAEQPGVAERFRRALARIDERLARMPMVDAGEVRLDEATIRDLRETGYIR